MQDKITEISAIIGGIYIILEVIVILTPNEADNRWMKKVRNCLKVLTVVFGLDINRGIKKYKPK